MVSKSAIPDSKVFVVKELHAPYFDPTFHFHPEHQIFLVLEGTGMRYVGDNIKPFKAGDLVFTGPNLPHVWRSENKYFDKKNKLSTCGIVIYFHDNFLGETILKEELKNIYYLLQRTTRGLEIVGKTNVEVGNMMKQLLKLDGFDSIVHLLKILDTIARSSECNFVTHNHYVSLTKEEETNRMNKVYEFVIKNFKEKILLEEVASLANMTCTSFSRYFKSRANKSFSDFLIEIRIDYACKLLKEEKMNIDLVGYECGFHTLSNFNKQFKKITGKQPLHYRREYIKFEIEAHGDF